MPRLKIRRDTWSCVWPESSLQECYYYWVTVLSFSSGNGVESRQQQTVIIGLLKGKLHSAHTHQQTHTHVVKQSSEPQPFIFTQGLENAPIVFIISPFSVHAAFPWNPHCVSGLFSVQQCPSRHEDPASEPDSADGELGTTSDHLPPTHHQLHGLLQLGETRCCRWKDFHQDRGPEHGECLHRLFVRDPCPLPRLSRTCSLF